jgi:hypothetical protein
MARILEKPEYSYKRRANYLDPNFIGSFEHGNVVLDDRGTSNDNSDDLMAVCSVRVARPSPDVVINGLVVPAKRVRVVIQWMNEGTAVRESLETVITLVNIN